MSTIPVKIKIEGNEELLARLEEEEGARILNLSDEYSWLSLSDIGHLLLVPEDSRMILNEGDEIPVRDYMEMLEKGRIEEIDK